MAIHVVRISLAARKGLRKVPPQVLDKFEVWVDSVERDSLEQTRMIPGYHDEPLHGSRKAQRSIRLNRNYRAIYEIVEVGQLEIVSVEEVNKHDY